MLLYQSDTVVPLELTHQVREILLERPPLKTYSLTESEFYARQQMKSNWFPKDDESYTANWQSYADCKEEPAIKSAIFDYIIPKFEQVSGISHESYEDSTLNLVLSLTKMPPGGHYRLHNDEYSCRYGFVWYLNTNWKWDWGGLLLTIDDEGNGKVTRPVFNNLIFLEHHRTENNWHCVTTVEHHAKEPRLSIIGFIK